MSDSVPPALPAPVWKRGLAAVLDFFTAFFVFGWLIGRFTGQATDEGFKLEGWSALVLFAAIVVYFYVGRRYGRRHAVGPHPAHRSAAAQILTAAVTKAWMARRAAGEKPGQLN